MERTSDKDRHIAELLAAVMDIEPDQRREALEAATEDPDLVERVMAMLEDEGTEANVLDTPILTTMDLDFDSLKQSDDENQEPVRRQVAHYTLEEVLGEGGMGRVYLAHQAEPIERQVALKLMRHGLSSAADKARFDAERRSLARLNHPNIAQMFEAGATEDGKLFFAMELVRGMPITRFCDTRRLNLAQRLHVFMDVLLAVGHAHQRQLLHRDLKPSNILVTEIDNVPMVKVIDFGISLGIDETAGMARQKGQRAGTPGYSSPEQLAPDSADLGLDTRADIYTLGIVLYELMCGSRPFDEPGDSVHEVWRKINENDPPHPAHQIAQMDPDRAEAVAHARRTRPSKLTKTISGDLDAIIVKAVARDREDRYPSVAAFYDDIADFLAHKPVTAQRPDFTYVAGLFVRRNLGFTLAGGLLVAAMALGLVAWSNEAHRANLEAERASREARQANEALAESRELSNFLVNLFSLTGQQSGQPERMTTEELLEVGAENLASMDNVDPLARARLRQLLGEVYTEMYMLDQAEEMVRQALATRRELHGPNHASVADSLGQLGDIYRIEMRYEDAEPLLLDALRTAQQATPRDLVVIADSWDRLGTLYWNQDRLDEAILAHERALEIREVEMGGQDEYALADSLFTLGAMLMDGNRLEEAEPYLTQAAELYERLQGNSQRTAITLGNLAHVEDQIGQIDDSEAHYRKAFEIWSEIESPGDGDALKVLESLVRAYGRWGRYPQGVVAGKRALALRENTYGPFDPALVQTLIALGINQGFNGDLEGAAQSLNRAKTISDEFYGDDSPSTMAVLDAIGWLHWQQENFETALSIHQGLLDVRRDRFGPDHALTAFSHHNVALALAGMGRTQEARALMERAVATWEVVRGPDHRTTAHSLHYLGLILWNLGEKDEAWNLLSRALNTRLRLFPDEHPDVQRSALALDTLQKGFPAPSVTPDH